MHIRRKPFEFWNYRDTRRESFPPLKPPALPKVETDHPRPVTGLISHHILLPLAEMPPELIRRLKADLTFRNPEFDKARKFGKGLVSYSIPEFVRFYALDTSWLGLPRSIRLSYLYNRFNDCGLSLTLKDVRPQFPDMGFKQKEGIRPFFYQNDAIERIMQGNVIIKLKCGRGKTILALMAVARLGLRTLILVRTKILMQQWIEAINRVIDIKPEDIGIFQGRTKKHGSVTVAMEETLVNLSREEKRELGNLYGHIIIDECHEAGATLFRELLTYFKARYVTGLSGTPYREDKMDPVLKLYIGQIVEIDDLGEFDTTIYLKKTNFHYNFVGKKDKYHELINALIHDRDRNCMIVNDVNKFILEKRMVVVYSNRIEHMEILESMIRERMPTVRVDILASRKYGMTMTIEDQEHVREAMRTQQLDVVAGGKIIEQGFDCPPLEVAILATPTKSRRLIEQVLGRCQREFPGKKKAILVDYIDEHVKILLYQFFNKNQKLYKNYKKVYV